MVSRFNLDGTSNNVEKDEDDDVEARFDRFKHDFFNAIAKLRKMQDVHSLLI